MQFALISCSFPWISARFKIIDAHGVEASTIRLALNDVGSGKKKTAANAKRGNIINFPAHIKYTNGFVKSFLKSIVARRIPKISIHTGVVIFPSKNTPSLKSEGSQLLPPVMKRGMATRNEKNAGFINADLTEMYFLS